MTQIIQVDKAELRDVIREIVADAITDIKTAITPSQGEPESPTLIYGIKGLAEFLNVSMPTAQKLKNGKLFPCYQRGRTIVFKSSEVLRGMESTHKRK